MGSTVIDTDITETTTSDKTVIKTEDEVFDTEPGTSSTTSDQTTGTGGPPPDNPLTLSLGEVYPDTAPTKSLETHLATWRSRIVKVTDPVAFMTSGTDNSSSGSYDKAILNKNDDEGFYELAKAELNLLITEIEAAGQEEGVTVSQQGQLADLSSFLLSYVDLYTKIQGTGSERGNREEAAAEVQGVVLTAQSSLAEVSPDLLGDSVASVEGFLGEISLFVASWKTIADGSTQTNASPAMWASFLQTVERYRSILNNYDKLEERGGDNTRTSKMSLRRENMSTVTSGDEADKQAKERGGYMAEALRSYNFYAADAAKMVEQLKGVIARLKAGEFQTEEECLAAFRAELGGGKASELFYKKLDVIAKGKWNAYLSEVNDNLSRQSYVEAGKEQDKAHGHLETSDEHVEQRDEYARTREDNNAYLGMDESGREELYRRYQEGEVDIVQSDVKDKLALQQQLQIQEQEERERKAREDEAWRNSGNYMPTDGTTVNIQRVDMSVMVAPTKDEIIDGLFSDQETSYMSMDQEGTDLAYDNAVKYQKLAEDELRLAQEASKSSQQFIDTGYDHALKAQWYLSQAKLHRGYATGDHPALIEGISSLDSDIRTLTKSISDNEELRQKVLSNQQQLDDIIAKKTQSIQEYNPEKLKVPMPTATVNGKTLEAEAYQQVTIDLSGPAWGVFWWMGGVKGLYSESGEVGGEDTWSKARIEAYAGLKADLWLAEAGVKVLGYFEARKKNAEGLADTIDSGIEELARWAYAWWYDLDSLAGDVEAPINLAITRGNSIYQELLDADLGDMDGKVEKARTEMQEMQQMLAAALIVAYSSDKGSTNFDASEALEVATKILPMSTIEEGLSGVKDLAAKAAKSGTDEDAQTVRDQITSDRTTFSDTAVLARDQTSKEIAKVDPGTNNPDVEFEAGVGIEGFAGFKAGNLSIKAGARKVYSISDGKEDDFNYDISEKTQYFLSGEYKGGGIEVIVTPTKEGYTGKIEATIPIASSSEVDGSGMLVELQDKMLAAKGFTVMDWATSVDDLFRKDLDFDDVFKTETGSKVLLKFGGIVNLTDDMEVDGGSAHVTIATQVSTGNKSVKVAYEQGNKVTLKFPSAKDKKKRMEDEALSGSAPEST